MESLKNYILKRKVAFIIALIYVGIGTISVCSVYPADKFYGDWSLFGVLITFPVTLISFGYRYAEADILYPVFIIQAIMFVLLFIILGTFIETKNSNV